MTSGRPGPVAVEMPMDMFPASADVTPVEPISHSAPLLCPIPTASRRSPSWSTVRKRQ